MIRSMILMVFFVIGISGCAVTTTGSATWELYGGVRTEQQSEAPSEVKVESTIISKIVDYFTSDKDANESVGLRDTTE